MMDHTSVILGLSNLLVGALTVLIAIPLVRRKVKMNRAYGIRIRAAFESEHNWYEINAYGGRQMILWAIPLVMLGIVTFFVPLQNNSVLALVVGCAPAILLVPVIMSQRFGNKLSA